MAGQTTHYEYASEFVGDNPVEPIGYADDEAGKAIESVEMINAAQVHATLAVADALDRVVEALNRVHRSIGLER